MSKNNAINSLNPNFADIPAETALLGSLLSAADIDPAEAASLLQIEVAPAPDSLMADQHHQAIWGWIKDQGRRGLIPTTRNAQLAAELKSVPADVWEALDDASLGGAVNPAGLIEQLTTVAARRNAAAEMQRSLAALARGEDPTDVASRAALALSGVSGSRLREVDLDSLPPTHEYHNSRALGTNIQLTTGVLALDQAIGGGINPGTLFIFIADSGTGKTRFSSHTAAVLLKQGIGVTVASGETGRSAPWRDPETGEEKSTHQVFATISDIAGTLGRTQQGIPFTDVMKAKSMSGDSIALARNSQGHRLLRIFDDELSLFNLRRLAVEGVAMGHKLLIVDNLEHVTAPRSPGESEATWLKNIAQELHRIAQSTGIAIMLLAQPKISEAADKAERPAERWEIADSKAIIRPAAVVVSAWRDADKAVKGYRANPQNRIYPAKLKILKARGGQLDQDLVIAWNQHLGVWFDPAEVGFVQGLPMQESAARTGGKA